MLSMDNEAMKYLHERLQEAIDNQSVPRGDKETVVEKRLGDLRQARWRETQLVLEHCCELVSASINGGNCGAKTP